MRSQSILSLTALFCVACNVDRPPVNYPPINLFEEGTDQRVLDRPSFDTLWRYGGISDTLLASADRIEAFPNGDAAVLDMQGQRVHRIGPEGLMWSWGTTGQGPGEIQDIGALAVNERGEVVVGDSRNRRLLWVSGAGDWLREVALPQPQGRFVTGTVTGVVPLEGGGYIVNRWSSEPWIRFSEGGELLGTVPLPWSGFERMHPLQTYGEVVGISEGRWAFGFSAGDGFFVFAGHQVIGSYPYINHVDFPAVGTSPSPDGSGFLIYSIPRGREPVARDLAVRADTLFVQSTARWLDRYNLSTGEYLRSMVLPDPVISFALAGDTLLVIEATGLFPTITALTSAGETK